ncbi:MAG: hypothetical protein IJS61_02950 [Firmicutes bacterium]|nr:hypothetical protein [Bacillota bacterium]
MKTYKKPTITICPLKCSTIIQVSSLIDGGQQTTFHKVATKSGFLNN